MEFYLRTIEQLEEIAQNHGRTFLRTGYEFVGWSLTPDTAPDNPGIIPDGAEVTFEDDTTLYAIWREEVVNWWPVSFTIFTESTGTGTVVMKYGNTQLTASPQIKDSNGNVIIKGNGTNAWLVRDGADVCINLMVNAAYNCNGYISLIDGDFTFRYINSVRLSIALFILCGAMPIYRCVVLALLAVKAAG